MLKTLSQMRKRLEEAMSLANDAEEIIPLVKKGPLFRVETYINNDGVEPGTVGF